MNGPSVVGFDGRDLLRKRTGVVNYTVHLARTLAAREAGNLRFLVYADGYHDDRVTPPTGVPLRLLPAPPVVWKHLALPVALAADRVDLFHSPTGTLPLLAPCPTVVTVHDLFADLHPEWFAAGVGARLAAVQCRAARSARLVVAVSPNTARDVTQVYGVPEDRVRVVPNGVSLDVFTPTAPTDERLESVTRRLGVRRPFVLCVGSLMPWRNAPRLLEAVALLRGRWGLPHELLFVGRDIWGTDPTAGIARQRGWGWAHFAGYVDDADLPSLYHAADVMAYPSLYEGFGIPPVEALACGTPVVASTAGSLPETLGDAALLVYPTDVRALAGALRTAIEDTAVRTRLRARGLKIAGRYTWQAAAEATVQVYREALAR